MNVHLSPTRAEREAHRRAQIRYIAVWTIGGVGAILTIALAGILWAALSAFTAALALGLMVAPGRNRAWVAPPPAPLDLIQVIAAPHLEEWDGDELAVARQAGVAGRHRAARAAKTVVAASSDNGGNGGN